jgi:hypothetical protein
MLTALIFPSVVSAWNIPTHMVSGAIAHQTLQDKIPPTIEKVSAVLEKHPWYANQWRNDLGSMPVSQRAEIIFMLAARWPDDVRGKDGDQGRPRWHYVNFPFKPGGEPNNIDPKPPHPVNILSALAENERILTKSGTS